MNHVSPTTMRIKGRLPAAALLLVLLSSLTVFGQEAQQSQASAVHPESAPIALTIDTVEVDFVNNLITITGRNFGSTMPTVKLADIQLAVQNFNSAAQ